MAIESNKCWWFPCFDCGGEESEAKAPEPSAIELSDLKAQEVFQESEISSAISSAAPPADLRIKSSATVLDPAHSGLSASPFHLPPHPPSSTPHAPGPSSKQSRSTHFEEFRKGRSRSVSPYAAENSPWDTLRARSLKELPPTKMPLDHQVTSYSVQFPPDSRSFIVDFYPVTPVEIVQFWAKLFHAEEPASILDLTENSEVSYSKRDLYYPVDIGASKRFGGFTVQCIGQQDFLKKSALHGGHKHPIHIYRYEVSDGSTTKNICRFHVDFWKADQADQLPLFEIIDFIQSHPGKMHIHSFKGVDEGMGRPGTILVALAISEMAKIKSLNQKEIPQQIESLIISGRKACENIHFVSHHTQYEALLVFAKSLIIAGS